MEKGQEEEKKGGEGDREREGGREGGWRRRRGRDVKEKEEDERGNTEIQIITKLIEFSRLPLDGQSRNEQGEGGGRIQDWILGGALFLFLISGAPSLKKLVFQIR